MYLFKPRASCAQCPLLLFHNDGYRYVWHGVLFQVRVTARHNATSCTCNPFPHHIPLYAAHVLHAPPLHRRRSRAALALEAADLAAAQAAVISDSRMQAQRETARANKAVVNDERNKHVKAAFAQVISGLEEATTTAAPRRRTAKPPSAVLETPVRAPPPAAGGGAASPDESV